MRTNAVIGLLLMLVLAGCAAPRQSPRPQAGQCAQFGMASWYRTENGRSLTADGERYRPDALTAAHRFLPFDTRVRVTDLTTGRSVIVRINDRGPFVRGRIIDLSSQAARMLGMRAQGVIPVRLDIYKAASGPSAPSCLFASK